MGEARPLSREESRRPATRLLGTRLFTISYVPLWAIFAVRSSALTGRAVFTLLAVWGLVDAFRIISAGLRRSSRTIAFDDISDKSADVSGYLATYLLPFIAGPPSDFSGWVAYAIYFLVAWTVFVPSRLGLVNPTLYVLGWQVVEATRNGRREIIISQDPPRSGAGTIMVAQFSGGLGWVQRPTRWPWTWASRRDKPGRITPQK
jgi:hypothetical protein